MAERLVVIDCGSGNLRSAAKAFERMAHERDLSTEILVSGDPEAVRRADRVVLPGVGAFGDCMAGLQAIDGMVAAVGEAAASKPLLGICVGMQLLATSGQEHGAHQGFSLIPGAVEKIAPDDPALKIPHMGWNALRFTEKGGRHPLFRGITNGDHAYFVHGYHFVAEDEGDILATVDHGGAITAAIGRDLMVGLQFHPEKSQATGLRILGNFLEWRP